MTPRGRGVRRLALAATPVLSVTLALTAGASGPAVADGPAPVLAAGTVTLTGSTTAYVTIRLPKTATLLDPDAYGGTPFATGAGRYLGFVLSDNKRGGVRILGGQQRSGGTFRPYAVGLNDTGAPSGYRVPAGEYRLYLLADGSPATVNVRFDGLAGKKTVRPSVRVPYTLTRPPVLATPGGTFSVGGAEATVPGRALLFDILNEANAQFVSSNTQLCFYARKPPPFPVGYGPGCPGGHPAVVTNTSPGVGATKGATYGAIADVPAGRYGQGFNRVGAAVTDSLFYSVGFLTLDAPRRRTSVTAEPARDAVGSSAAAAGETAARPVPPNAPNVPGRLPATGGPETGLFAAAALAVAGILRRTRGTGALPIGR